MPDPGAADKIEAAFKDTRRVLGLIKRFGGLRGGKEDDPDHSIRSEARHWLTLEGIAPPTSSRIPNDIRKYLLYLVTDWELDPVTEATRPVRRRAPSRRERRRPANTIRDHWTVDMIAYLRDEYSIKPTRNRESRRKRDCGCSIVAKVLGELGINLTETGVEEVWRQLGAYAQPKNVPKEIGFTEEQQRAAEHRMRQLDEFLARKTVRGKRPHLSRMTRNRA
jgi:hypothetical protein